MFLQLKTIKYNLAASRMTISCQVSQKKREQARDLAEEEKKTFGKKKGVGFSNSIWFGNAHLGCRENKHNTSLKTSAQRK